MPVVTCKLGLFDYDQSVYIINDDGITKEIGRAPYESLPQFIASTCADNDINEVILSGSKYYTQNLKKQIEVRSLNKYDRALIVLERE